MTITQLEKRIERLRKKAGDSEGAHWEEDQIRKAVLRAISEGSPYARELARLALTTSRIDFPRWYA
jgi:alpha-D-ribose 1-methylphosphonate 5-triphosphate synthase subunit PhnI